MLTLMLIILDHVVTIGETCAQTPLHLCSVAGREDPPLARTPHLPGQPPNLKLQWLSVQTWEALNLESDLPPTADQLRMWWPWHVHTLVFLIMQVRNSAGWGLHEWLGAGLRVGGREPVS